MTPEDALELERLGRRANDAATRLDSAIARTKPGRAIAACGEHAAATATLVGVLRAIELAETDKSTRAAVRELRAANACGATKRNVRRTRATRAARRNER